MIRIAVVDNDADMCAVIKNEIERAASIPLLITTYSNPEELKYKIQEGIVYDEYFLDIDMPVMTGLELAAYIRAHQEDADINFLTSHGKYALDGYNMKIRAENYVLKDQMKQYIPLIVRSMEKKWGNHERFYIIENKVKYVRIELSKIYYAKADAERKNILLVTEYGVIKERNTLSGFLERAHRPEFIRVERGYVVNIHYILAINNSEILMKNGDKVQISRDRLRPVRQYISEYWGDTI